MIKRSLQKQLARLVKKFPVISVTGPRQSGKTTLIKSAFPGYRYESLEEPATRLLAQSDPVHFLDNGRNMIIDEIQRVPELFSYIQTISDRDNISGRFIISGSQSFLLNQHISQSLAGRIAILNLMPFSLTELSDHGITFPGYERLIYKGFYPRLYDKKIDPPDFYPNYLQTYIERDVRLLQNIQDLNLFIRFLKLCAGRIGQMVNHTSLANDCGISPNTARAWLSVLEASFIIFLLPPHFINFNKRLVKMPKLFFTDTGLAASLLDINSEKQIAAHYLRGALFENLILSEFIKNKYNAGLRPNFYFWRDNKGVEIDCIIEKGSNLIPVELKSGYTYSPDYFKNIIYWNKLSGQTASASWVVYGGELTRKTADGTLLSWRELSRIPL